MLNFGDCRGFISNVDSGENTSYYLANNKWYCLFSPESRWVDDHSGVFCVFDMGPLRGYWVNNSGGVHFTGLCYKKLKAEAGEQ